jgi:hypothetical protein
MESPVQQRVSDHDVGGGADPYHQCVDGVSDALDALSIKNADVVLASGI